MKTRAPIRQRLVGLLLLVGCLTAVFFVWQSFSSPDSTAGAAHPEPPAEPEPVDPKPVTPPPSITGTVFDDLGSPLSGASVLATCGEDEPILTLSRMGRFVFRDLPPGECRIEATFEGHVAAGPDPAAHSRVTVRPETPLDGVVLTLNRGATLAGRVVTGPNGAGNVALSVLYHEAPGAEGPFSMSLDLRTDTEGRFSISPLGPGRAQVLAEHDEFGLAESREIFLAPGDTHNDLEIRLEHTGTLTGTVIDDAGRPVADARVSVSRVGSLRPLEARSDARGEFFFEAVGEGDVSLTATAHGMKAARLDTVAIAVGQESGVRMVLERLPGFGGIVLTPAGEPAPRAAVYVRGAADPRAMRRPVAHTDDQGRFWIAHVPPPPSVVWARHAEYAASADVAIGGRERDLELNLEPGGRIAGSVVNSRGDPIGVYAIQAITHDRRRGPSTQVRDPSGEFSIPVEPGRYALTVSVPGKPAHTTGRYLVRPGGETDVGRIVIAEGGSASGRVIDPDGQPLAGVRVRSEDARMGRRAQSTTTGPDGRFTLSGLVPGSESLYLTRGGYLSRMVSSVRIDELQTTELGDIRLDKVGQTGAGMQYTGVGISIRFQDDRVVVAQAFEGGPAQQAGLGQGTAITTINGRPVTELNPKQIVQLIRGEPGTEVTLDIIPPGGNFPETIRLSRGEVVAPGR